MPETKKSCFTKEIKSSIPQILGSALLSTIVIFLKQLKTTLVLSLVKDIKMSFP